MRKQATDFACGMGAVTTRRPFGRTVFSKAFTRKGLLLWGSRPSSRCPLRPPELGEQPVDLLGRFVVDEAGAHGAAVLQAEPLHQLDRVVVPPPDGDVVRPAVLGDLLGGAARAVEGGGGGAPVHRRPAG